MPYASLEDKRKYQREYVALRRANWLEKNGPCCRCGSTDRLEVDHKDPYTKINHRVWSWSEKRREAELAKCQVLCASCHIAKTAIDRRSAIPHGTETSYRKLHCRCGGCLKWKRQKSSMEYKRRKSLL